MAGNTRRSFLGGALGAPALLAQANLGRAEAGSGQPFPGAAYHQYSRCLPDYLRGLAASARRTREAALAKLTTPAAIQQRQRWVRQTLVELIGSLPERTNLNAKTVGSFERAGYRVERLVYESRPDFHIPANLYIPAGKPPFPAVLFQLGHSGNGKAYDSYQRACQGLVKLGFLVLSFDPMGQGERIYYPGVPGQRTRLEGGADGEHTVPGRQMLLTGTTSTQMQLWDAIRSLDYLASHPLADATRLASTGQSGGATLTMLLCAVDDRLKTAAVFSGNTENVACRNFLPPGSTDDAEQNFVGCGPLGFDRWDLFYPFAPKPLLISVSDKDSFGTYSPNYVSDGWEEYQKLAAVYKTMGAAGSLSWADTPLPHGLSYDSRLQMYNWMLRHLKGDPQGVTQEPAVAPEPDSTLWVTPDASVISSFGGATPFSLTRQRAGAIAPARTPVSLEKLLRLERPTPSAPVSLRKVPSARGVTIEALEVPCVPGVVLPVWQFHPSQDAGPGPILLLLHPGGRNRAWHEGELCHSLALDGMTVCAADVRGIGDMAPEFSPGAPGYMREHQEEENYAWGSLILGRPLLGQRTTDVLALARALRTGPGGRGRRLVVAAYGAMAVPALCAACLDPGIERLYLAGGLSSFRSLVETEDYRHSLADFVPGVLGQTDLPELVAQLAPRKVVLGGMVDAAGKPHSLEAGKTIYAAALQRGHVEFRAEPGWSLETLRAVCR
ncbi:alpha/beta hydrolase family protein [Paludibaculum fermentans]|uniref:Acetylxylan esterase n=1 Tax=Paludibaculum fermentans TaxID=1473598 RepID=A0A7S7NPA2_PALFE|nr:acetylxylan esterase [Paludibaculum fermentans]QOY87287.1 acetylxylan esterase [Paludibaculum fermentans]